MITSVKQGYEFTEGRQDYKTELRITYREREAPMNIVKAKDNYNRDKKPRYLNYNIYRHIVKECQKPRKCYKCDKIGHLAKYCRSEQKMKIKSTQEESNNNNEESLSFVEGLK